MSCLTGTAVTVRIGLGSAATVADTLKSMRLILRESAS